MKMTLILLFLSCVSFAWGERRDSSFWRIVRKGVEAKIVLFIVDEQNNPVPDADVHAQFSLLEGVYPIEARTDEKGKCILSHRTCGNKIVLYISKVGYYESKLDLSLIKMECIHDIIDGKWQPYPIEKKIVMRRKLKPASVLHAGWLRVPETNVWIGVDMEKFAFVRPHGNGRTADFQVCVRWDGLPPPQSKYCDVELRFITPMSGGYYSNCINESHYPLAYEAMVKSSLERTVKVVNRKGGTHIGAIPFRENAEFVTRTRCVLDEDGNVVSSNFGSIFDVRVGPSFKGKVILNLSLVFNSTPNDTGLEPKNWPKGVFE